MYIIDYPYVLKCPSKVTLFGKHSIDQPKNTRLINQTNIHLLPHISTHSLASKRVKPLFGLPPYSVVALADPSPPVTCLLMPSLNS